MYRELPESRKLELMTAFLDAYGATETRPQVDVFLRALFSGRSRNDRQE
jgi:hypothetical protein